MEKQREDLPLVPVVAVLDPLTETVELGSAEMLQLAGHMMKMEAVAQASPADPLEVQMKKAQL